MLVNTVQLTSMLGSCMETGYVWWVTLAVQWPYTVLSVSPFKIKTRLLHGVYQDGLGPAYISMIMHQRFAHSIMDYP